MPPTVGGSPIGVTAPASTRTRRSTADAGKIPATLLPRRRRRDASSLGPRPAHSRLAVPTREHQRGGPPIHAAPTRFWPTSARPPPGPPALQGNTRSCSPAASHLTTPFHIRRSSASATASATSPTTACGCCCTAASPGTLTEPNGCEAAHHVRGATATKGRRSTAWPSREDGETVACPTISPPHELYRGSSGSVHSTRRGS
jgi:hypothetical protein